MSYPSATARNLRGKQHLLLDDFAGGLNLLSAPSELADNETGDCMNVTLDEKGGVVGRLGYVRRNVGALPGVVQNLYYWPSKQITVFQIGATLYKTPDDFGTWSSFATFTTTARATFTDFAGKLVVTHPIDGTWTYDNTTWTLVTASVKGVAIANWQNKVWVADVALPRVWWSNAGVIAFTVTTDFNDLREKDDELIVALGVGQGMDVAGRPGLLAFKRESTYRINSSSTGSYTTIDSAVGAAGPLAVATLAGVTAVINRNGIYTVDSGGANELQLVSGKLRPLFLPDQIAFDKEDLFAAGVYRDRFVFSLPKAGSSVNTMSLEYHPAAGWIVPHNFGVAAFTTYRKNARKLYAASPLIAYVFEQFKGGNDDGAAIVWRFQTRWFLPSDGIVNSFTRVRVSGRGAFNLFTMLDYTNGQGELNAVNLLGQQLVWNTGVNWNDPLQTWGPLQQEDVADFYELGFARAIAFRVTGSSSAAASGAPVLDGAAPEIGAAAMYGLLIDFVVCGNA